MSQNYRITSVEDTTFEPDQYGNVFYSIEVEGFQGRLLWKTKARPETGVSVYGHTEPSKSGKAMLFKKDQIPEDGVIDTPQQIEIPAAPVAQAPTQSHGYSGPNKDEDIKWAVCIKAANEYLAGTTPELNAEKWAASVTEYAQALYRVYTAQKEMV